MKPSSYFKNCKMYQAFAVLEAIADIAPINQEPFSVGSFANCREQGFCVSYFANGKEYKACFAEDRSSDNIVVYIGDSSSFCYQTNRPNDKAQREYFLPSEEEVKHAARFVVHFLTAR